jgi:hypothetical protein
VSTLELVRTPMRVAIGPDGRRSFSNLPGARGRLLSMPREVALIARHVDCGALHGVALSRWTVRCCGKDWTLALGSEHTPLRLDLHG